MVWGPIISAAGSLLGGVLSDRGAARANKRNIALAREQMAFQERMSSTAYQRSMADMKKAGLNPILAYQQGGASTPPGAMPTVQNEEAGKASSAKAVTRQVLEAKLLKQNIKNLEQQEKNIVEDTGQKIANQSALYQSVLKQQQEIELIKNSAKQVEAQTKITNEDLHSAKAAASAARSSEEILNTGVGKFSRKLGTILREINPLLAPATKGLRR